MRRQRTLPVLALLIAACAAALVARAASSPPQIRAAAADSRAADAGPGAAPSNAPSNAPMNAPTNAPTPAALQSALLKEALYIVRRDHCILTDGAGLAVPSYEYDAKGRIAPMKAPAPSCDELAKPLALLSSLSAAVAFAAAGKGADAPNATALEKDVAGRAAAFQAVFGRPLMTTTTITKAGRLLASYDPVALAAAFDAVYVAPSESRLGAPMKALYAKTAQAPLARLARDLAALLQKKPKLAAEAKKLEQRAHAKDDGGLDALRASLNVLVDSNDDAARIDPVLVGFVLRRQRDGTLPVVVSSLQRVLQDYDPEAARVLASGGRL